MDAPGLARLRAMGALMQRMQADEDGPAPNPFDQVVAWADEIEASRGSLALQDAIRGEFERVEALLPDPATVEAADESVAGRLASFLNRTTAAVLQAYIEALASLLLALESGAPEGCVEARLHAAEGAATLMALEDVVADMQATIPQPAPDTPSTSP